MGVFVNTLDPFIAGMALSAPGQKVLEQQLEYAHHDATGLGERSTSTKHILQVRIC
jgi:hypothetical protein